MELTSARNAEDTGRLHCRLEHQEVYLRNTVICLRSLAPKHELLWKDYEWLRVWRYP